MGDLGSVPELGRSPGGGHGNPLQYSCLENPMDGGAWWVTVHGAAKSRTRLSDFRQKKNLFKGPSDFGITADSDCSHEIKRCLLFGRKAITNLYVLKSIDITLLTKVHSQSYGFSSIHVCM